MPQGKIKDENTRVMVVLSKDVKERAAKLQRQMVDLFLVGFVIL